MMVPKTKRSLMAALVAGAALALAGPVTAHTSVRQANIAEGARLAENPRTFTMEVGADSGLASVQLTDAAGKAIPLDFTPPRAMAKKFSVPLPALAPGGYRIAWRMVGGDGHVMTGGVSFSVGSGAAPPITTNAAPTNMLASSTPANGATLASAPRVLALQFTHPVLLQTVAIANAQGTPVRANFRRPTSPTAAYSIALPPLTSGVYSARWAATGGGHTMQGSLGFTVR